MPSGRAIAPVINTLLALPFSPILATRDWHPATHISFAANHANCEPYTSTVTIVHPSDASRSYVSTLWPVHCVQDTPGAQLVPELDLARVTRVVDKGMHPRLEMYSAFYDPFRLADSGLAGMLRAEGVTDVFVVGLAADYCVKATAEHAREEGYQTFIVEEGTRPVVPEKWEECKKEIVGKGIKMVSMDSDEIARVQGLA